jgi:hypothetical protein
MNANEQGAAPGTEAEAVIVRLADVLLRENTALGEGRRDELAGLTAEKLAACRAYEALLRSFADNPDTLAAIDDDQRHRLRQLGDKLIAVAGENARRLEVAVAAHRRFMDTVAEAARAMTPGPGTYSRKGSIGQGRTARGLAPVAVSVNRSL